MTRHEKHLWYDFLKLHKLQFNRQRIIGNYIVDFYCDKANLVIELDGSQHYEDSALEYDFERTQYLKTLGIHVLRFSNLDIDRNFKDACRTIENTICLLLKEGGGAADG